MASLPLHLLLSASSSLQPFQFSGINVSRPWPRLSLTAPATLTRASHRRTKVVSGLRHLLMVFLLPGTFFPAHCLPFCPISLVNGSLSMMTQLKYCVWAATLTPPRGREWLLSACISPHWPACLLDCLMLRAGASLFHLLCPEPAHHRDSIRTPGICELSVRLSAGCRKCSLLERLS